MTISSETTRVSYAGDGTTVDFSIPFTIHAKADVVVILRDADGDEEVETLDTDYEINDDMDTLTWIQGDPVDPPAAGETLVILRDTAYTQAADWITGDPMLADVIETAADKLTMLIQQVQERVGRAAIVEWTSSLSDLELPVEASKFLQWNAAGDALVAVDAPVDASEITVTTWAKTLLLAATAAAARTILGVIDDALGPISGYDALTTTEAADELLIRDDSASAQKRIDLSDIKKEYLIAKSANYECTLDDCIIIASGNGTTITLPENATAGTRFIIKRVDASYDITVSRKTADTIDGATSIVIRENYGLVEVVSDGANYHVVRYSGQGAALTMSGALHVRQAAVDYGAILNVLVTSGNITLSGATATYSNAIAGNSIVLGVCCYVTTEITGASGFQVGVSGALTKWADKTGTAVGTKTDTTNFAATPAPYYNQSATATDILITAKTAAFTGGKLRVVVYRLSLTSPTS